METSLGVDDAVLEDIRAVGASLGGRVPELIEDFYRWLSRLPEFERFFPSRALLAQVKSAQAEYWRDFLRAEVDDDYVERRRVVGYTHARIELGLLIYLRAMEFVSAWLIGKIAADERLAHDRPNARHSIRQLIQFDSAIVVQTYASRTASMLEGQRDRLAHVAQVMRAVTAGDLGHELDVSGPEDLLGQSVNDMVRSLRGIAHEMQLIAQGDYSGDVAPRGDKDELGVSLQAMTRALRAAADRNEQLVWMASTQSELGEAMSGNPSVKELSQLLRETAGRPSRGWTAARRSTWC